MHIQQSKYQRYFSKINKGQEFYMNKCWDDDVASSSIIDEALLEDFLQKIFKIDPMELLENLILTTKSNPH